MPDSNFPAAPPLDPRKFKHPDVTAGGETRAAVDLAELKTLWFNTGSLCNIACVGCYMESSPVNDRLAYITTAEAAAYLDEIRDTRLPVEEIGFTGGEPFMNPDFIGMLELALSRGFKALVLTNAMKPMDHKRDELLRLKAGYGGELSIRVSIDHPDAGASRGASRAGELGADDRAASNGWARTGSTSPSPAGPGGRRPKNRRGGPTRDCSPNWKSTSMRWTPPPWCCSRKWTRPWTCRRSPPPAGTSWAFIPIT